jgi:hypothetical protein
LTQTHQVFFLKESSLEHSLYGLNPILTGYFVYSFGLKARSIGLHEQLAPFGAYSGTSAGTALDTELAFASSRKPHQKSFLRFSSGGQAPYDLADYPKSPPR